MAEGKSARQKILDLFLSRVGETVTKEEIAEAAQINEWARRIRELRDEMGYKISSFKDRPGELKPGEYVLYSATPDPGAKQRKIGKGQRYRILNRDGHRCLSCGRGAGETNPSDPNRTLKLVVDHAYPISAAEAYGIDPYADESLQTLCDACNEGKKNEYVGRPGEARANLEALVRRAPLEEQRRAYEYLREVFGRG